MSILKEKLEAMQDILTKPEVSTVHKQMALGELVLLITEDGVVPDLTDFENLRPEILQGMVAGFAALSAQALKG